MRRLFAGLPLPDAARKQAVDIQVRLRAVAPAQGVRFVAPPKLHVTLVFLGLVDESGLTELDAVGRRVCARHTVRALYLRGLGGFPDLHRPKVLWLALDGDLAGLSALQQDLASALGKLVGADPAPGGKPFSPHLTLARISPGSKEVGRLAGEIADHLGGGSEDPIDAPEVLLFESNPSPALEVLYRWPTQPPP